MGSFLLGCSSVELTKVPKKPLPAQHPQLAELPLELPPERGPRRPVDAISPTTLSGLGPEIIIVEIDQSPLRTTAEQDAAVKQQLGDRFAFIGTEEVPADQCLVTVPSDDPPPPRATERSDSPETSVYRLIYYSYTNNVAVHGGTLRAGFMQNLTNPLFKLQAQNLRCHSGGHKRCGRTPFLELSDQRILQEVNRWHAV
jgi:hypothetical protein